MLAIAHRRHRGSLDPVVDEDLRNSAGGTAWSNCSSQIEPPVKSMATLKGSSSGRRRVDHRDQAGDDDQGQTRGSTTVRFSTSRNIIYSSSGCPATSGFSRNASALCRSNTTRMKVRVTTTAVNMLTSTPNAKVQRKAHDGLSTEGASEDDQDQRR